MAQNYKIRNMLKDLPFYSDKINKIKKKIRKLTNARILSELPFFPKKPKELTNYQLSKELPFFSRKSKLTWIIDFNLLSRYLFRNHVLLKFLYFVFCN